MRGLNVHQAKLLAAKGGWTVYEYGPSKASWTISFHRHGVTAVHARYSATGQLTKVEAVDFASGKRLAPTRDKSTALFNYLDGGSDYIRQIRPSGNR